MQHIKDFLQSIEEYYGKYANDTVRGVIYKWLNQFNEQQLRELFDLITDDYSNTYKMPPDKNRLIEAWEKKYKQSGLKKVGNHYEDEHGNVFDSNMKKIGHYDGDRFLPLLTNERLRKKVVSIGSVKINPDKLLEYKGEEE